MVYVKCSFLVFSVEGEEERRKLKYEIHLLKDELASAQTERKLALTRAVRPEIQADKVAVLEQQLSQTKTNLQEQIRMKDQARIAAEQQLQQTKSDLQHEILVKDQAVGTLHHQLHQMKEHQTEMKEQAILSAQQQFDRMKATLEHQIEEKEQARVALEIQIQTKDKQLKEKKEEIHTKDREKAELQQQLCQKEEQVRSLQQAKVSTDIKTPGKDPGLPDQLTTATHSSVAPSSQTEVAEMQQQVGVEDICSSEFPLFFYFKHATLGVCTQEKSETTS